MTIKSGQHEPRGSVSVSALLLSEWAPYGPLTRYVKLQIAHAPGIPGTLSPPPRVSDPDMRHDTCVTHMPWCMPESLTSRFLWSRWRGKRSRHSRCMCNPQFYVAAKRPICMWVPQPCHHFTHIFLTRHLNENWNLPLCIKNTIRLTILLAHSIWNIAYQK